MTESSYSIRIIMVVSAVMVLLSVVQKVISMQQQQVIWPTIEQVGILGNRMRVIALKFCTVYKEENCTERDFEIRNTSMLISEYCTAFIEQRIGYG